MKKSSHSNEFKRAQKALLKIDSKLSALFERHQDLQFAPQMKRPPYESLIRAVANQQLHGKAAQTILNRFIALVPERKFPSPEDIMSLAETDLRACGFSQSKVKSIRDIAAKTLQGVVPDKRQIQKMSNDEIVTRLTEIYGVGKWTVEMLLIFQLGRLDVWPIDDFGVRRGLQVWKRKKVSLTAKDVRPYGDKWAPYQTVVALYLWREADRLKK